MDTEHSGSVEWPDWDWGKGIWLLNDHVKQSPPVPPFLHPSLLPSPSAPHSAPLTTAPWHAHTSHSRTLCADTDISGARDQAKAHLCASCRSAALIPMSDCKTLELIPQSRREGLEAGKQNRRKLRRSCRRLYILPFLCPKEEVRYLKYLLSISGKQNFIIQYFSFHFTAFVWQT